MTCSQDAIDLFYGDESGVSLLPCVPYGWQFADEQVFMPSISGKGVNCFALLTRDNRCFFRLTEQDMDAGRICDYLDQFAQRLRRPTVVVLDNAPVHHGQMRRRLSAWQNKQNKGLYVFLGLYVFFLPTYSPHLNIAEVLWRKLKYEWLQPEDYASKETLRLAFWQAMAAVGRDLTIAFQPFRLNAN